MSSEIQEFEQMLQVVNDNKGKLVVTNTKLKMEKESMQKNFGVDDKKTAISLIANLNKEIADLETAKEAECDKLRLDWSNLIHV